MVTEREMNLEVECGDLHSHLSHVKDSPRKRNGTGCEIRGKRKEHSGDNVSE